jgi:sorbose reductase
MPTSVDCPLEMKEAWYKRMPLGHHADSRELKEVYLYLMSDVQVYITVPDIISNWVYHCEHIHV